MQDLKTVMERLLLSKKLIYAAIPIFANLVAGFLGIDPTSKIVLVVDAAFALLLIIQAMLDFRFGSPSDGTSGMPAAGATSSPETVQNVNIEKK